jgi:hypothetical protein
MLQTRVRLCMEDQLALGTAAQALQEQSTECSSVAASLAVTVADTAAPLVTVAAALERGRALWGALHAFEQRAGTWLEAPVREISLLDVQRELRAARAAADDAAEAHGGAALHAVAQRLQLSVAAFEAERLSLLQVRSSQRHKRALQWHTCLRARLARWLAINHHIAVLFHFCTRSVQTA